MWSIVAMLLAATGSPGEPPPTPITEITVERSVVHCFGGSVRTVRVWIEAGHARGSSCVGLPPHITDAPDPACTALALAPADVERLAARLRGVGFFDLSQEAIDGPPAADGLITSSTAGMTTEVRARMDDATHALRLTGREPTGLRSVAMDLLTLADRRHGSAR